MTKVIYQQDDGPDITVNLRNPFVAALLAWAWPGLGHFYQGRFPKGFLFMVCILSTFFAGLALGEGRVVYASMKPNDFRWQFFLQAGIGLPAVPALAQTMRVADGADPFFVMCERYPNEFTKNNPHEGPKKDFTRVEPGTELPKGTKTYKDGFMAPPAGEISVNDNDVLGQWNYELKHFFGFGTLYTVVAGLLNLLAIYDAFSGPAIMSAEEKEELEAKKQKKKG